MPRIPIYEPFLQGNEKEYVLQCLDTNWISSRGEFVNRFETEFSRFLGVSSSSTCANGTVALHLALLALDIGPGDEVIVPAFTYVATANAIKYMGANPVFVDSDHGDWNMSVSRIEEVLTPNTKAVLCVHIYGVPCDIHSIMELAEKSGFKVIEDCAEALGSYVDDVHVGCFGDIATFSFFGNKTITTGEGGMVVSRSDTLIADVNYLKNQSVSSDVAYWHERVGYNYRLTNIASAIGLAQLENIETILEKKKAIADVYREYLSPYGISFQSIRPNDVSSHWLNVARFSSFEHLEETVDKLNKNDIETRPAFPLVSSMPHFHSIPSEHFPNGHLISRLGLCLPSYPNLSMDNLEEICRIIVS